MQRPQRSSDKHAQDRTILGHPSGLFVLFFTEMWERFSYYGMRSLLVLYMVDYLFQRPEIGERVLGLGLLKAGFEAIFGPLEPQPLSSQIYGFYTALVYLTPFFGGILADKVIGQRRAVILASRGMGPEERRSVAWLLGTTFILTLGELYLSPIGLSFVTKMSPAGSSR